MPITWTLLHRALLLFPLAAFSACLLALISINSRSTAVKAAQVKERRFDDSFPANRFAGYSLETKHDRSTIIDSQMSDRSRSQPATSVVATVSSASSAVMERQKLRQRHLTNACASLSPEDRNSTPARLGNHMYTNDRMRFIYCKVEKAACTTWKRTLIALVAGNRPPTMDFFTIHSVHTHKFMRPLSQYKPDEIQYRREHYYTFMFVREPLERLVSAYRDKIVDQDRPPYAKTKREIQLLFAKQGDKSLFQAFVRYVIHRGQMPGAPDNMDAHWRPQHSLCHPCYDNYPFVGHYETLYDDANHVIQRLKPNTAVRFPRTDPDNIHVRSLRVADRIFSTVSDADIKSLLRLYSRDYELFGYSAPQFADS